MHNAFANTGAIFLRTRTLMPSYPEALLLAIFSIMPIVYLGVKKTVCRLLVPMLTPCIQRYTPNRDACAVLLTSLGSQLKSARPGGEGVRCTADRLLAGLSRDIFRLSLDHVSSFVLSFRPLHSFDSFWLFGSVRLFRPFCFGRLGCFARFASLFQVLVHACFVYVPDEGLLKTIEGKSKLFFGELIECFQVTEQIIRRHIEVVSERQICLCEICKRSLSYCWSPK